MCIRRVGDGDYDDRRGKVSSIGYVIPRALYLLAHHAPVLNIAPTPACCASID